MHHNSTEKIPAEFSKAMDTFCVYGHPVDGEMQSLADIIDKAYDDIFLLKFLPKNKSGYRAKKQVQLSL